MEFSFNEMRKIHCSIVLIELSFLMLDFVTLVVVYEIFFVRHFIWQKEFSDSVREYAQLNCQMF